MKKKVFFFYVDDYVQEINTKHLTTKLFISDFAQKSIKKNIYLALKTQKF